MNVFVFFEENENNWERGLGFRVCWVLVDDFVYIGEGYDVKKGLYRFVFWFECF